MFLFSPYAFCKTLIVEQPLLMECAHACLCVCVRVCAHMPARSLSATLTTHPLPTGFQGSPPPPGLHPDYSRCVRLSSGPLQVSPSLPPPSSFTLCFFVPCSSSMLSNFTFSRCVNSHPLTDSFIPSFNGFPLSTYCMPDPSLGIEVQG